MNSSIDADIAAIQAIGVVPTILQVVADTTGMRFACVTRVTKDSWTACAVLDRLNFGLHPGDQLDVTTTLCDQVRDTRAPVVIDQASTDPKYREHVTPRMYGFESYLSFPLFRPDGEYFGTLCALDPLPAHITDEKTTATMTLFAQLISLNLENERQLDESRTAQLDARQTAELREQFIAVLGHDLRTPLASIMTGADILLSKPLDAQTQFVVSRIRRSGQRISSLVDDVLDFTRGRMGGGIALQLSAQARLADELRHVVAELQGAHPQRTIRADIDIVASVFCDRVRVAQLLSNLLNNALVHGAPDQPVDVVARLEPAPEGASALVLGVSNRGPAIAEATLAQLFQPYQRGPGRQPHDGLGLGLYIAAEIARSHGGRLDVSSTDDCTCFTFILPQRGTGAAA